MAYRPASDRMMGMFKSGTWAFDPVALAWTPVAGPYAIPPSFSPTFWTAFGLLLVDSDADRMLGVTLSGDPNGMSTYRFDFSERRWTRIGSAPTLMGDLYGVFVPNEGYFLIHDSNWAASYRKSLWKYWMDSDTWTDITGTAPSEVISGTGSWAYDTLNRVVIAIPHRSQGTDPVWVFNPASDSWFRVGTLPFGRVTGSADLQYDAANNVFVLTKFTTEVTHTETWAYRYRRGPSFGDSIAPSPPSNFRTQ